MTGRLLDSTSANINVTIFNLYSIHWTYNASVSYMACMRACNNSRINCRLAVLCAWSIMPVRLSLVHEKHESHCFFGLLNQIYRVHLDQSARTQVIPVRAQLILLLKFDIVFPISFTTADLLLGIYHRTGKTRIPAAQNFCNWDTQEADWTGVALMLATRVEYQLGPAASNCLQ